MIIAKFGLKKHPRYFISIRSSRAREVREESRRQREKRADKKIDETRSHLAMTVLKKLSESTLVRV